MRSSRWPAALFDLQSAPVSLPPSPFPRTRPLAPAAKPEIVSEAKKAICPAERLPPFLPSLAAFVALAGELRRAVHCIGSVLLEGVKTRCSRLLGWLFFLPPCSHVSASPLVSWASRRHAEQLTACHVRTYGEVSPCSPNIATVYPLPG